MKYTESILYGLESKRLLRYHLRIGNPRLLNQVFVASLIKPYVDRKKHKPRLIEVPDEKLKVIQTRLKDLFSELNYPEYVFSGIRWRSYVQNAKMHEGKFFLFKLDLTAFFPSIAREKVFTFFREDFHTSPDVAEILTNFTTIDLDLADIECPVEVDDFMTGKGIKTRNHLISGSPTSPILSYLVNQAMFDHLHDMAERAEIKMSVYVDDIVFTSLHRISRKFRENVRSIIRMNCYRISSKKTKLYRAGNHKKVTGVIINKNGELSIPSSLRMKIIRKLVELKANPDDTLFRKQLRGLLAAARQIEPHAFPSIYAYAYDPAYRISEK